MADVKGGAIRITNQIVGSGDTKKAEAEALIGRMFVAAFVQRTDQAKEAIGIELQAQQIVHLLHEDHDRRLDARQQDLVDEFLEAVHRAQHLHAALLPPAAEGQRLRQAEILA